MIVVMEQGATEEQIQNVITKLVNLEFSVHRSTGVVHTVLGGVGPAELVDPEEFRVMDGVKECLRVMSPYKLASRRFKPEGTVVRLERAGAGVVEIGGPNIVVMAGPPTVESEDQVRRTAEAVAQAGARFLRAGAFRPRNSPYQYQGLGESGLKMVREAADEFGLFVATEVIDLSQMGLVDAYSDMFVVGSRHMQNYVLLRGLGEVRKPVLLKRGVASTMEELLLSAEYILLGGNYEVILCERGIRTFEMEGRSTMDISAIPAAHKLSHLPILADPSHATGRRDKVTPMARASVAAGADGLLIDVHPDPDAAQVDGAQSLNPEQFAELMTQLRLIAPAVGRTI
ncbi:3-deoxy-7-phosphoheptulonate synthase [uncultured Paludibaculum sp.]|uniref:3-deoxy-7-phosphoheptulonate synthase n=1 Tax=uncultured Paludibaculum sp. TaxID=1765020 RepID=UPI002AAAC1A1|nr:3-deoxy-7-phosphoheptulonate synthase [uncultured Paludibaculum sp.]